MNDTRHDITSMQLMAFLISAQIGIGILNLPAILAQKLGHDGWISTIATGIICLVLALIITYLLKRYLNKTIFQIYNEVYGKIIGFILSLYFILYMSFITGITLRIFMEAVNIGVLKITPPLVITILILLSTIYGISKGLKVICRFSVILFFSYFILILTLLLGSKYARFTYLLPIGESGLRSIVQGIKMNIYAFLGFELIAPIYPNIKNKEKTIKYMAISIIFTTIYYALEVVVSTMIFGEIKLSMLVMPVYNIEQSIQVPVIERLDTLYILFWFPTMASTVRAYLFSTYYSIQQLFKVKKENLLIFIIVVIEIIISRIPRDFEDTYIYSEYAGNMGAIAILIIIITFFISIFKRKVTKLK
ncbi:spore gernimation protein [Clostridium carboxidivorans P7]|uniref:Spore germination protein n=1 Tax=Clostridium carboxidivorans P7 TaxID=536227 RepID=C6PTH7_9CLOT|nr:endospore germination permease [Clostridium carboxidivorans]AKN33717.1 spore gernimation protein [Clostridium carboxidivorans P7]EET87500.1 spore germination protein [Clostridium carboxidivorans P7]EFG86684.1 spore germination protein (amino acid permease) [Clostridium carboxidivorans P7]